MIFKATINVFVDVDCEAEACDALSEGLRPLLRRYAEKPEDTCFVDWAYTSDGQVYSYPTPATQEEIDELEE